MRDINYFRLQQLPTILLFVFIGFWLKHYETELSKDQIIEITGTIASNIEEGDIDGSNHFHQFRIDKYDNWFRLDGNARSAVNENIGLDKFESMTKRKLDVVFKLGVDKEELENNKKVVSIRYLTINGQEITNYEDYERLVMDNENLAHRIYWLGFVIAGIFLIKALLVFNFRIRKDTLIKPSSEADNQARIDREMLFEKFKIVKNDKMIEISDSKKVIVRFDLINKYVIYRKFWFYLKTPFDSISDYGIYFDNGDVDFMIRLKRGLEYKLMKTRFGLKDTSIELDNRDKYLLELTLFSIMKGITHPNKRS